MLEATLVFDCEEKLRTALDGYLYKNLLWEYDQWLRSQIKYSDRYELQPARDKLYELLKDDNLSID